MEKLHVREGRAELERGKEALAQQNPRAAPALSTALSHYEAALQLNESNTEARAGADEARRLLPEALTLAGQSGAERGRPGRTAIGHRCAEPLPGSGEGFSAIARTQARPAAGGKGVAGGGGETGARAPTGC